MGTRGILFILIITIVFPVHGFFHDSTSTEVAAAGRADRKKAAKLVRESRKQDDMRAVRTLLKALLLDPESSAAFYRLGYLHHKMNRRVPARRYYNQAIKLNGCHAKALNNLAGLHLDGGDAARAEKMYRRAIRCSSRFHAPFYNLALILQERGDASAAARYYRRTLRLKPDHHRSHHNLGLIYTAEKRTLGRGVRHLKRAADLNPRNPLNHFSLGKGLFSQGKHEQAREAFQRALGLAGRASRLRRDVLRYMQALDAK